MANLESLTESVASLRSEVKNLTKLVRKIRSFQEDPTGEKTKKRTENNGFNRKMEVSDKLKSFLGLKPDEYISRSDVTRRINTYIKDKELKHPDNGRVIVMDASLTDLLSPPDDVQVTFLNMQKYISPHYLKAAPVEAAPVEEAEAPPVVKKVQKRPTVKKVTKA